MKDVIHYDLCLMSSFLTHLKVATSDFVTNIVIVSPGTHLVKNHESLSITNESQFKKTGSPKLKMLRPLCNQTVDLEKNAKTLYLQFTDRRNHMNRILYQKNL